MVDAVLPQLSQVEIGRNSSTWKSVQLTYHLVRTPILANGCAGIGLRVENGDDRQHLKSDKARDNIACIRNCSAKNETDNDEMRRSREGAKWLVASSCRDAMAAAKEALWKA